MLCVRAAGMCLMCSDVNERMTARNESALRAKQMASAVMSATPHRFSTASVPPASSGPSMRATLNWIELSAMALVRSCLPTSEGISDWYAGPPNACAVPVMNDSSRMCQTWTLPKYTSAASDGGGGQLHPLRRHQREPPIVPIGDDPADEREQHDRQLLQKRVETEVERRRGQRQHQPVFGQALHPGADAREAGAEPEDAEVAMVQSGGDAPDALGWSRGFDFGEGIAPEPTLFWRRIVTEVRPLIPSDWGAFRSSPSPGW